jgi:hypothetical protein
MYEQRANVLTFNYDTLLETAIARGSPANSPQVGRVGRTDIDLHARWSWNPLLAYKVHFDELVVNPGLPNPRAGEDYYSDAAREAAHPAFLKLHGSVDWFYRSGYSIHGARVGREKRGARYRFWRFPPSRFDHPVLDHDHGEILLPLIITPVLNKPVGEEPFFRRIWQEALEVLKRTKTLVVAGYSFPAGDFHVRRLLREAFADNPLEELCVVNPDASVASVARDLCNFRRPVLVCRDLGEYLSRDGSLAARA